MSTSTSREELAAIIGRETTAALVDMRAQVDAMPASQVEKDQAWALLVPLVERRTAAALLAGWERLQLDAARDHGAVIH